MDKILFTTSVQKELEKLKIKIESYQTMSQPISPDDAIGRVSRMDAINNKSVNDAALREAELRFQKLKRVLENINNPDFGLCRSCHQPIPEGRLLIRPESVLCVKCASRV